MSGVRYFAYGSNMEPGFMLEHCPSASNPQPARLDGFRVEFTVYSDVWGGGAANLEVDPDARVWGIVWDVHPDELKLLDTFQGHPTFYRRERVVVDAAEGPTECTTYRVAHQSGYVRPTDAYLTGVRNAIAVHGLPPEALEAIERAARPPSPRIST
ncbi:MAG: gamma-glutamylcyclotransferase [Actinobacteria bacterium]|nr:gamma-glutamylcyclotransferase [Actinomycetota bacterium]